MGNPKKYYSKMEPVNHTIINPPEASQIQTDLADKIYSLLNEGSLFEIYKIMENLNSAQDKKCIKDLFNTKFDINFIKYI